MTRKPLHIVKSDPKPRVTFSLLRRAISLYKHADAPREQWKRNARAWVRSVLLLGDRHILKGTIASKRVPVAWGVPGDGREVGQVFAPRGRGGK